MLSLQCEFCGISASLKCGGCKNVVYCTKEHQKLHWKKGHKAQCKCYEISVNSQFGRHLKATRDIKQGEIILRELPLVYGPKVISSPICLGCNQLLVEKHLTPARIDRKTKTKIPRNYYKCSKCKWPLCGPDCENSKLHVDECNLMANKRFQCNIDYDEEAVAEGKKESAYCAILPLRCLLLKKINPKCFQQFLQLEDHLDERLRSPMYNILKLNLLTFFKTILGLDEFDEMTILKTAAILDTNTYEIRLTNFKSKIRAIFPNAAMISHDCVPNTKHVFDTNLNIIVIAAVDIKKGDIITASYGQPLQCTIQRRLHLRQTKCFDCMCNRCCDSTEIGTFIGSIICKNCKQGKLISVEPLNNEAVWKCDMCSSQLTAVRMRQIHSILQQEIESLPKRSPYELELFLNKYCLEESSSSSSPLLLSPSRDDSTDVVLKNDCNVEYLLHGKNTFVLQVKYALTQLYGNVDDFLLHDLSNEDLNRKIALCNELLEIADLFEPGWSMFRGRLLMNYQEALELQTDRLLTGGVISMDKAQEQYQIIRDLLKEAYHILRLEPEMGTILEAAIKNLSIKIH